MTILTGGKIDVTGLGYASDNGPGIGTCGSFGASYGGEGGVPTAGCKGPTYGSYSAPTNIGSGGHVGGGGTTSAGGAVILNITNTLTVNGSILTDGLTTANPDGA